MPSVTPSPTAMPTPRPTAQNALSQEEQVAKNAAQEYLKNAGLEVPDKLPYNMKSWKELADTLTPEWEEKARQAGILPDPTKGADPNSGNQTPAENPSSSPNPNATPSASMPLNPDASGNPSDSGNGDGGGWGWIPNPSATDDPNTPFSSSDPIDNSINNTHIKGDYKFDAQPSGKPIPLDYRLTDLGMQLSYDNVNFTVTFPDEARRTQPGQKLKIEYVKPRSGEQSRQIWIDWKPEWINDLNAIALAVIVAYNQDKASGQ